MRRTVFLFCVATMASALVPLCAWAQATAPGTTPAPHDSATARDKARPVAAKALTDYDEGRYTDALAGFQQADSIYPAPQYRAYIARSYAKLGQLVAAARTYNSVLSMPAPSDAAPAFQVAQMTAQAELADLQKRLPTLSVVVGGPSPSDAHATLDGQPLDLSGTAPIPVDPGTHTVNVQANGFEPVNQTVYLSEGHTASLNLVLSRSLPPPLSGARAPAVDNPPQQAPTIFAAEQRTADTPTRLDAPTHRGQLGVVLRGDFDTFNRGVLFAPGLSYGLFDHLDVGVSALLGQSRGVEPNLTLYVLKGAWKPLVQAAAPIFPGDGVRTGIRGAVGMQWDPNPVLGLFAAIGGAYFQGIPEGSDHLLLLPSAGLQGRL